MAFKMTFPTIKGSPVHKKSTVTPTVSMSRTTADPSLVAAASELGKSNIPGAIDYRINIKQPTFSDSKSKPRENEAGPGTGTYKEYLDDVKGKPGDEGVLSKKEWKELNRENRKGRTPENQRRKAALADQYEDPFAPRYTDEEETVNDKFNDTYPDSDNVYDSEEDKWEKRTSREKRTYNKKKQEDLDKMIVTPEGEEEAFNRAEEAYNKQREEEESSALELRKQSVFKNAIKGGKIQKELIKQGFDPYK